MASAQCQPHCDKLVKRYRSTPQKRVSSDRQVLPLRGSQTEGKGLESDRQLLPYTALERQKLGCICVKLVRGLGPARHTAKYVSVGEDGLSHKWQVIAIIVRKPLQIQYRSDPIRSDLIRSDQIKQFMSCD